MEFAVNMMNHFSFRGGARRHHNYRDIIHEWFSLFNAFFCNFCENVPGGHTNVCFSWGHIPEKAADLAVFSLLRVHSAGKFSFFMIAFFLRFGYNVQVS